MTPQPNTTLTAQDMRARLTELEAELHATLAYGLDTNATFMADLEADLTAAREAYIGLAVTEIATFRGQLSGHQLG